jgi:hypothetical protein
MSPTEHPHDGEELFDDPEVESLDLDLDDDEDVEDIEGDFEAEEDDVPDDIERFRGG